MHSIQLHNTLLYAPTYLTKVYVEGANRNISNAMLRLQVNTKAPHFLPFYPRHCCTIYNDRLYWPLNIETVILCRWSSDELPTLAKCQCTLEKSGKLNFWVSFSWFIFHLKLDLILVVVIELDECWVVFRFLNCQIIQNYRILEIFFIKCK